MPDPHLRPVPRGGGTARLLLGILALALLGSLFSPLIGPLASRVGRQVEAQGRAELGPAPQTTDPALLQPSILTRPGEAPSAINRQDRQAVVNAYTTILAPALTVPVGWTGSIAGCVPGSTSSAYEAATLATVNYFRAMAGLPDTVTLDPVSNSKDQQSALMTIAQGQLSHTPPPTFACYTPGGAEAAANSNLAIGAAGPDAITLYMEDPGSGNTGVGHRRWILYPPQTVMGTGSTSGVNGPFQGSNSLWVTGPFGARPTSPEFVAWPPPGFVPRQIVYPRWSFAYNSDRFGPNAADLSNAQVSMTRNGQPVPLILLPVEVGFGDNTLVWEPQGLSHPAGMPDTPYQVTVSNVRIGGLPRTVTYSVTVIDPTPAPPVSTPTPTIPVSGTFGGANYSIATGADGAVHQTWNPGTAQLGYLLFRLNWLTGVVDMPAGGPLGPAAVSFTDTFPTPGGIYCYLLVPFNASDSRRTNILCAIRNTRTPSGAPEVTLRLDQSTTARLDWSAPVGGGHTGYIVRLVVGAATPPPPLGPTATGADIPVSGLFCLQVEALGRGSSDILCGIPGISNL